MDPVVLKYHTTGNPLEELRYALAVFRALSFSAFQGHPLEDRPRIRARFVAASHAARVNGARGHWEVTQPRH